MAIAVTMPQLGESVVEGTVARWLKAPGDRVTKLEPLLEINTDKIDTEVPCPADGTLLTVLVEAGRTVRAGTVLGYVGKPGEQPAVAPPAAAQAAPQAVVAPVPAVAAEPGERPVGRGFVSPVVAKLVAEHGVDLAQVTGTGLHGRVSKQDVLRHVQAAAAVATSAPVVAGEATADEVWQPLTAMRRAIAQHMVQSKRTSPHVTTVFEADMTAVVRHREAHKEEYARRGVRLTYTPYFVAAAAQALRSVPAMNARFHEAGEQSAIVLLGRVHIGVAVSLGDGLIVPVIRDADERTLAGLARAVNDVAEQARRGDLTPAATHGGTFTITNHGVGGSLLGTPILHQPQAGILGVGAIVKRPVVRSRGPSLLPSADDAIVIRPMCYLSLTFDHRVLDGAAADAFMTQVVNRLVDWLADAG